MANFRIWGPSSKADLVLMCRREAVALFIWQRGSVKSSVLLNVTEVASFREAIDQVLATMAEHAVRPGEVSLDVRLVGHPAVLTALQKHLEDRGVKVTKTVTKYEDFEAVFYPAEHRLRVSRSESQIIGPAAKLTPHKKKTRVLVIDDSTTMRRLLVKILEENSAIEVIGSLGDPKLAASAIERDRPDVVTVDLHMPGLSGVELIRKLFPQFHLPMIVVSSLGLQEGSMVLDALEAGAVDYLQKPESDGFSHFKDVIQEKVIAAAGASVRRVEQSLVQERPILHREGVDLSRVVAIGASTGGTEAIKVVLSHLPEQIPPLLITQHIPPVFSQAFAQRLDKMFPFQVKEAEDGDVLAPNCVFVAPGGKQMRLKRVGADVRIVLGPEEKEYRHNPSVDVLFESVAAVYGRKAVGVILTGMGKDGTVGMQKLKAAGALTVGQDEATSVVYGMPRAAFEAGAVDIQKPLERIGDQVVEWLQTRKSA